MSCPVKHAAPPARKGPRFLLTIVAVNYNSSDFFRVGVNALRKLTRNPWKLVICDNGSAPGDLSRLRRRISGLDNISLFTRKQTSFGSMGHGEALNFLARTIDTPYGVVMDADCIPLAWGWDELLINRLDGNHPIIGTPLAVNTPKTDKPKDFPLIFLCLFDTAIFKKLKIDFRPKDLSRFQDTGWELREKYRAAGFEGKNLFGQNTRSFKKGPFARTICDEYYLDPSMEKLICAHFGRGSSPWSGKYGRGGLRRLAQRYFHGRDKKRWLSICERIVDLERTGDA